MGYTGLAPGSYWTWRPSHASLQDNYKTLVTEFESGAEQRRGKWDRPKATLRFQFDKNTLTHNDVADIWRFYQAKQGALRTFEVPTFGRITTVESTYPGSGAALGVADTRDFTSSAASRWNKLWVENAAGDLHEVWTVASVVNATHLRVTGSTSGSVFNLGDPVYPVLRVRFAQAIAGIDYLPALMGTVGIEFTEVHS